MAGSQRGRTLAASSLLIIVVTLVGAEPTSVEAQDPSNTIQPTKVGRSPPSTSQPFNISGTFKGEWLRVEDETHEFLEHNLGLLVFRLSTYASARPGLHAVRGDVVLRDGLYVTENDVAMKLQGIYVQEVGKLTAVLEPITSVHGALDKDKSIRLKDPNYRSAIREAGKSIKSHMLGEGGGWNTLQDHVSKKCEFVLDVTFTAAAGENNNKEGTESVDNNKSGVVGGPNADLIANGTLTSSNCHINLQVGAVSAHVERYYAKAVKYTLMITGVALAQVALTVGQMESASTQALASRVSLLCIGQQAVLDAYLCLLHLTLGILVEPLFNAFATAAFVQFVVFGIFEMRLLLVAWRARRGSSMDPWTAQRELSTLYARFYGALLAGILLSYQLQKHARLVTLLLHTFWIPQIVLCMREDCRQPLKPSYVVGTSIARLLLPLYIYGCPHNLLRISPSPGTCFALIVFVGLQAGVLVMQYKKGARCFVPKRFLPPKYDYFRPLPRPLSKAQPEDLESGVDTGEEDCVICMNPINPDVGKHMVAPCNHIFHQACLERWLNVKMECPTCRRQLPPP